MSKEHSREVIRIDLTNHFWKIKDNDYKPVPLDCPVCKLLLRDREDVLSYQEFECCTSCADVFVYPNRQKWISGWRPSQDKINSEREKRRSIPTYILK